MRGQSYGQDPEIALKMKLNWRPTSQAGHMIVMRIGNQAFHAIKTPAALKVPREKRHFCCLNKYQNSDQVDKL